MADKMTAEKIVKTMRYCCDDIKHNEECNLEKCYQVGLLETRDGDSRFCRQWLIHDAADLIENQAKEIESLKAENELLQKAYDSLEPTFIQMGHENENYKCHIENLTSENSTLQSKIKEFEGKNVAKKVVYDCMQWGNEPDADCPTCGHNLENGSSFCRCCGQGLEWSK